MIGLSFENRVYKIEPDFKLLLEIEDELGALPELLEKFSTAGWRVSELVALVHILLYHAGRSVDYIDLGNYVLTKGAGKYLTPVKSFLESVIK